MKRNHVVSHEETAFPLSLPSFSGSLSAYCGHTYLVLARERKTRVCVCVCVRNLRENGSTLRRHMTLSVLFQGLQLFNHLFPVHPETWRSEK